ncbi:MULTISPECIES: site-specific integrase [unclassified Yoonia]|uniref:tyrosine-type recombinase/integrase n=1 Tax=unclassified Yoonia TaxID=2629118 RepID=UPI002AFF92FD|nr:MULTISPECIES: site-specific integrase [unclassified Yoonia]
MGRSATKLITATDMKNLQVGKSIYGYNLKVTRNKNGNTFYASFSINGRRYFERLGTSLIGYTLKQASHAAAEYRAKIEREIQREKDGDLESDITMKEAAKIYIEDMLHNQGKNYAAKEQHFRQHLIPQFGDMKIKKIHTPQIKEFRTKLIKAGKTTATVNRIMATLSNFYKFAISYRWLHKKPYEIESFKEEFKPKDRIPETEKLAMLNAAKGPGQHPLIHLFVLIGFGTGMRHREILKMRWENIHWDRNEVWLPDCKTGPRMQLVPVSVIDALQAHQLTTKQNKGYVFVADTPTGHITTMRDHFAKLCRAAGVKKAYTPHFMRHTVVSDMAERGFNTLTIMAVSGHKVPAVVARYAHLHGSSVVRNAIEGLLPTPKGDVAA